jgi:predicted phage terminase large subunit-like protein
MGFVETKSAIRDMSSRWPNTSAILIEDKANGSAIIDELRRELPGVIPIEPEGGKTSRAWACTAQVEAGQIYIPEMAPWAEDFLLECSMFPAGAHDDMVDAMTQVLNWRRTHGFGGVYAPALVTSNDNNGVIYDAAAWRVRDPGYSNAGWYQTRSILYVPGVVHPTCFLEIGDSGKTIFVMREYFYDQALASNSLTSVNILQHLFEFSRGRDPLTGVQHRRSSEADAAVYLPDMEEYKHVRSQLWMLGQYMVVEVEMPPEELMGDIARITDLLDRRLLRISNECPNTIAQLRNYRLDMRKAMASAVEQPLDDGRSPCCTALRMYSKHLNIYRFQ